VGKLWLDYVVFGVLVGGIVGWMWMMLLVVSVCILLFGVCTSSWLLLLMFLVVLRSICLLGRLMCMLCLMVE